MSAPNPSTPEATRPDEVETWELGYGRGITGPTACQWHYMPGWSNDFQIVTLPNSASGDCNTVVAVIPKAQAKWMDYSHLIAAAPELLEAARMAQEFITRIANTMPVAANGESLTLLKLSAAIQKAERGQ